MLVLLFSLRQKEDTMAVEKKSHHALSTLSLAHTKHKHRQVDLDFLSAINPEGLLPHSLVFTQMPNGAYNAAQRNGLSFFPS